MPVETTFPTLRNSLCILAASLSLAGCAASSGGSGLPERITAERGGFIPEGIEYDQNAGRFLTGSLSEGTIYAISNAGGLSPVIEDPELEASVGIEVEEERNRLLVANARLGAGSGAARLGVYDLGTGEQLAMVDLTEALPEGVEGNHFANDVAVTPAGTAFVTDTAMNIIYRVDRYYRPSVLVDLGRDSGLSINGIVYHPGGYLITVSAGTGQLIKVPLNNPQNWRIIELDYPAHGGDGLVWTSDGELVSTSNNVSRVMRYRSEDNWRSAELSGMASFEGQATTAAVVGEDIYVVQPHFQDDGAPEILRVRF